MLLALETHGGLLSTGQQGAGLLKRLGPDKIFLTYDMANVVFHGGVRPQVELARLGANIGHDIAHVHLKNKANVQLRDSNFPTLGRGILDFRPSCNRWPPADIAGRCRWKSSWTASRPRPSWWTPRWRLR